MTHPQPAPAPPHTALPIAVGAVIGDRFKVEEISGHDGLGVVLRAQDAKTKRPIAVRVLSESLAADTQSFEVIRQEVKEASKLKHRSIAATYGVGTHEGSSHFIASEWVQGVALSRFVQERLAQDEPLSVRGAYNVVAHVCKALAKAHDKTFHGMLSPATVWVTRAGRIKVSGFGLSAAVTKLHRLSMVEETEQAFLAPEIRAGQPGDLRSDIFGIGALLYVMLTGRTPLDDFVPPSQARPDVPQALDEIMMKCLAAEPAARYQSALEVSRALLPLVAGTPEPHGDEFGVEVDVDIDIQASLAPPAPSQGNPPVVLPPNPAPAPMPEPSPATAQATPLQGFAAAPHHDPATAPASGGTPEEAADTHARRSDIDLAALTQSIVADDAPRWMIVKDNMDHGPFSGRELVDLILKGEAQEHNGLLNMDTGERQPLGEYPDFVEFVKEYKVRKSEQEHEAALQRSNVVEKRANVAKFLILTGGVAVLLIAGGVYLMSRQAADKKKAEAANLAALYESGQVEIKGSAGILKYKRRKGGGSRRASRRAGGFSSYEQAMNQAMELGNVNQAGGERQLTARDVEGVMNRRLNSLFRCVSQELRRGGKLGTVRINLAIAGSGKVLGASVTKGSKAFQSCMVGKIKRIRFPSFPAPRMGARYSFSVD